MVPSAGLEPALPKRARILSPLCLPIPPRGHNSNLYYFDYFFKLVIKHVVNKRFNISYNFNLYLIKFYKWKIENFCKKNLINFIISHYDEDFNYINFLPNNQQIYIYVKKKIKNFPKKDNIKILFLHNYGREYQTYLYHIKNHYNKLADINFFTIASFFKCGQMQKLKNFRKVYGKISFLCKNKYNGLYTSEYDSVFYKINFFKKLKLKKTINKNYTIEKHISNNKIIYLKKAKIRPLDKWFKYYFKNKPYYHLSSMTGIFAANKENILQVPKRIISNIEIEYRKKCTSYESGHYLERLYPSIFYKC